jgi:hypothetical protein
MNTKESNDSITTDAYLNNLTLTGTHKVCISFHLSNEILTESQFNGALGYGTCPIGSNNRLVQNCTRTYSTDINSLTDITPVFDKESNKFYRNIYCALCHKITEEHLEFLRHRFSCKSFQGVTLNSGSIVNTVLSNNHCVLRFVFKPGLKFDSCIAAVSKCKSNSSTQDEIACRSYRSVIEKPMETVVLQFENPHCMRCNGLKPSLLCKPDSHPGDVEAFAFSGLLKQEDKEKEKRSDKTDESLCSENEIYDTISVRMT